MERRQPLCLLKKLYVFNIEKIIMHKILPKGEVAEEDKEEEILEEGASDKLKVKNLIFIAYAAIEIGTMHLHVSCLGTKLSRKEIKKKVKLMTETKVKHLNLLIMLYHIVTLE